MLISQETPDKVQPVATSSPIATEPEPSAGPSIQQPPYVIQVQEDTVESIATEEGRQDKWNAVMGAIKDNLSTMLHLTATPRKVRRIPDEKDPETKTQPVRLPLHPAISAALDACREDIQVHPTGDLGKQPRVNPDRQAPGN